MGIMFRYEHTDGKGPYTSFSCPRNQFRDVYWKVIGVLEGHCINNKHPGPQEDMGLGWTECGYRLFGCSSTRLLFGWFDGLNEDLITLGFRIMKIESTEITYGKLQCACRKNSITSKVDVTDEVLKELKNA